MEVPAWLERTELLTGSEALVRLAGCHILLVGLGGVGSYAGEFLARAGIGKMTIVDGDVVDPTNINRQLQALHSTVGMPKAELMEKRLTDINPALEITAIGRFLEPEDMDKLISEQKFDFVLDCIDSVTPKLTLIQSARRHKIRIISSMGAGGKSDPSKIRVADISVTRECKFAQTVRKRLKRMGIRKGFPAVFSEEIQPHDSLKMTDGTRYKRSFYGTISYMPALFGMTMSAEVIRRLAGLK